MPPPTPDPNPNAAATGGPGRRRRRPGRDPSVLLAPVAGEVLAALAAHHLLSSRQLRELLTPHAKRQWMSRQLVALHDLGLVAWVGPVRGEGKLWYLTRRGAALVGERPEFADRTVRPLDRRQALSQNQRHILEANEVGVQLARWARRSDPPDQFGVRSWRNEVSHRFADGGGKSCWLRPDAIVRYDAVHPDGVTFARFFVELDRHTETAQDLGGKLANYCRLYGTSPGARARRGGAAPTPSSRTCWWSCPASSAAILAGGGTRWSRSAAPTTC